MTKPDINSEIRQSTQSNQFEIDLVKPERAVVWHPQFAIAGLTLGTLIVSTVTGVGGYNLGYPLVPEISAAVGGGAILVGQLAEFIARRRYGEPSV